MAGSDDVTDCVCNAGYLMNAARGTMGTGVHVVASGTTFYRTLDGWDPQDNGTGCQSQYMAVPPDWKIAAYNNDSIAVAAAHPW